MPLGMLCFVFPESWVLGCVAPLPRKLSKVERELEGGYHAVTTKVRTAASDQALRLRLCLFAEVIADASASSSFLNGGR